MFSGRRHVGLSGALGRKPRGEGKEKSHDGVFWRARCVQTPLRGSLNRKSESGIMTACLAHLLRPDTAGGGAETEI